MYGIFLDRQSDPFQDPHTALEHARDDMFRMLEDVANGRETPRTAGRFASGEDVFIRNPEACKGK